MIANCFPGLLQSFSTERLFRRRCAIAHAVTGYRDVFRLAMGYAAAPRGHHHHERLSRVIASLRGGRVAAMLGAPVARSR
jgi:hypothetical protein